MSRPRFLADHDLNEHIVHALLRREPALEVTRARQFHLEEQLDEIVLEFAADRGMLVVSQDVNTMPAVAYARMTGGQAITGLVMVPQSLPVAIAVEDLILIWSASEAEEWPGEVRFLPI